MEASGGADRRLFRHGLVWGLTRPLVATEFGTPNVLVVVLESGDEGELAALPSVRGVTSTTASTSSTVSSPSGATWRGRLRAPAVAWP